MVKHRLKGLAVAMSLLLSAVLGTTALATTEGTQVLPDLGMAPLEDFGIERKGGSTVWLRFSTIVVNVGDIPFEVVGAGPTDTNNERHTVYQRVDSSDGTSSLVPTLAWMFWARDGHDHWHVDGLQTWELAYANAPTSVIRTGKKTGFCFWDNYVYGSTQSAHYHPNTTSACDVDTSDNVPMGLSVGWGDEYPASLTDQYIDISGLPWGDYVLTVTADPRNEFYEKDDSNNVVRAWIRTRPSGVDVLRQESYVQPIGSNADAPPVVAVDTPDDGAIVSGTVPVGAAASDDRGVASVDFLVDDLVVATDVDGSDGWSTTWESTLADDGSHSLTARATDTNGATAEDVINVTVDNQTDPGGATLMVDLDGSRTPDGPTWTASVTISVADADTAVDGASVTYRWSDMEPTSCTTAGGVCEVTRPGIRNSVSSVTLVVENVTHPDYSSWAGESSITVAKR